MEVVLLYVHRVWCPLAPGWDRVPGVSGATNGRRTWTQMETLTYYLLYVSTLHILNQLYRFIIQYFVQFGCCDGCGSTDKNRGLVSTPSISYKDWRTAVKDLFVMHNVIIKGTGNKNWHHVLVSGWHPCYASPDAYQGNEMSSCTTSDAWLCNHAWYCPIVRVIPSRLPVWGRVAQLATTFNICYATGSHNGISGGWCL